MEEINRANIKKMNVRFHLKDPAWQTLRDLIMSRISVYDLKRASPNSKYGPHDEARCCDAVQAVIRSEIDN